MKFSPAVSSKARNSRRRHFNAPSSERRVLMSAPLSKELREKYGVRSVPIRKDDEVKIVRGSFKDREGKVSDSYRKKFVIHVEGIKKDKANGQSAKIGISASNVVITKLKLTNDRKDLLKRKADGKKQMTQ
jgi:large subunit ribosomal protein L26e